MCVPPQRRQTRRANSRRAAKETGMLAIGSRFDDATLFTDDDGRARSVELYLKICPTDEALRALDKCDLPERAKVRERLVRGDRYGAIEAMRAAMGLRCGCPCA